MKTVKQWLKTLPTEQKNKALNNLTSKSIGNLSSDKASNALLIAFSWKDAPEGFEYWDNAWEALLLLRL